MADIEFVGLPPNYIRHIEEDNTTVRGDFFAIKNFKQTDSVTMHIIDSFAEKHYEGSFDSFANYTINFYRYSSRVNENVKHDQYSDNSISIFGDELIVVYEWHYGKFLGVTYFKDGQFFKGYEDRKLNTFK